MTPNDTKRAKAMEALLTQTKISDAAKSAGIGRKTLYRYMEDPAFCEELAKRRTALFNVAMDQIKTHASQAIEHMQMLMTCGDVRTERLACKDIIEFALRGREIEDLESRLSAIEQQLTQKETKK